MSYRHVQDYPSVDAAEHVSVGGREFSLPCLVEDDDGLRWLVHADLRPILAGLWARAAGDGAVGIVSRCDLGWRVVTTERFMDDRVQEGVYYRLSVPYWTVLKQESPPTLADLYADPDDLIADSPGGFVHLHVHSEMSPLDGVSTVAENVAQVVADQQPAVALTDHGVCSGHPALQRECEKAGIKPLFGIEAYFIDNRLERPVQPELGLSEEALAEAKQVYQDDQQRLQYGYTHLVLLAMDDVGLRNIWAASTESFADGFYRYPRMDWSTLERHAEGVICLTGCLRGPLADPILKGDPDLAVQNLSRLSAIYGDRLYIEIHANALPEQHKVNLALVEMVQVFSIPMVAVVDSHYPTQADYDAHKAWVAIQTASDVSAETDLFSSDIGLYMKTEAEVRESLSYLPVDVVDDAIANTVKVADRCTATIKASLATPTYSKQGGPAKDAERLLDLCLSNWAQVVRDKPYSQDVAIERFEREFKMIVDKGFAGYYLMVSDYCLWAKRNKILIGPGRGSGGASYVARLAEITGIDPIEADLLFERFMTEGRTELPDFDVDFPASKRDEIQDYVTVKYGHENVIRVGTHLRLRNKGVIKDLSRAMKSVLPDTIWVDAEKISAIITAAEASTTGLGLTWEELWAQEEEVLAPYLAKYPTLFAMAERLVGRLKSYGKHAAGVVISAGQERSLMESLPLRSSQESDDQMISQFEMGDLSAMGLVKFDFLTLRTLDTVQANVDLIEERRHHRVDPYNWREEYDDPEVWDEIGRGNTLGMFQIETRSGMKMAKQMKPVNLSELSDVLTLVRPGPKRSGLTDLYLARRAGEAEVSFPDPRLEQVLAKTHGVILYQEDVMATCMILAGYSSDQADQVRKILGKKQVEKVVAEGRRFVEGCVNNGGNRETASALWEQLSEFARYGFNKSHAYGYAVLCYWTAFLKIHYGVEFSTAVLSTVDKARVPEFVNEARRLGLKVLPPDINESGRGFKAVPLGVRYGLDSIKGIGDATVDAIVPEQPFTSFEDFMQRKGSKCDAGSVLTLAKIGAFDSLEPNRRGLETLLLAAKDGSDSTCVFKDLQMTGAPNNLPCRFDWANEPRPVGRTGKFLKAKPVSKKCTKACRNYTAPEPMQIVDTEPYSEADIREIEGDMLGVYLSSTPYDRADASWRTYCLDQAQMIEDGPLTSYCLLVIVQRVSATKDRNGNSMAFVTFLSEVDEHEAVVFSKTYAQYQADLIKGALVAVEVTKTSRGLQLESCYPLP